VKEGILDQSQGKALNTETCRFPVAREGFILILPPAAVTVALLGIHFYIPAGFFALLTLFVIYFFRDPKRSSPPEEKAVLSPADGKVIRVESCFEERFLKGPAMKISIFMSIFNVHINRVPVTGRIVGRFYSPGKFFSANLDKASLLNEQNALLLETPEKTRLVIIQIAGLIARRIVCRVTDGDPVARGQRFGLIRFGSRLDVYLPQNAKIQVQLGQKVFGGQTILGILS
jgi:phosphatidylserine decarboxylase